MKNTIVIALVGKGGMGKTSISALTVRLLAQKYPDKKRFYNKCWGQAMSLAPTFIIEPVFSARDTPPQKIIPGFRRSQNTLRPARAFFPISLPGPGFRLLPGIQEAIVA